MQSILESNNLQDFYLQLDNIEEKKIDWKGYRLVTIQGNEYYFTSIVDKFFELIRSRDHDPDCLIPKIFTILSKQQNEFYSLYNPNIAYLVTDYLGKKQAQLVSEIQLFMTEKIFYKTPVASGWEHRKITTKDLEDITDNFAHLNFDCEYLLEIAYNITEPFCREKIDLNRTRKIDLLPKISNFILKNRDYFFEIKNKILKAGNLPNIYTNKNMTHLHETYACMLYNLPNEDQMAVLLNILKSDPEFLAKVLRHFFSYCGILYRNSTSLKNNEVFALTMLVAERFLVRRTSCAIPHGQPNNINQIPDIFSHPYKFSEKYRSILSFLNLSKDELYNFTKNAILFLCAKEADPESNFNKGLLKDIVDLIIKTSIEDVSSKAQYELIKR